MNSHIVTYGYGMYVCVSSLLLSAVLKSTLSVSAALMRLMMNCQGGKYPAVISYPRFVVVATLISIQSMFD